MGGPARRGSRAPGQPRRDRPALPRHRRPARGRVCGPRRCARSSARTRRGSTPTSLTGCARWASRSSASPARRTTTAHGGSPAGARRRSWSSTRSTSALPSARSRRPCRPRPPEPAGRRGRTRRSARRGTGRVVAVWGPAGAPGRTSVAVAIADEASRAGVDVLLVDADTWAPSVSVVLGLVDDGAGLASACRRALGGGLDVDRRWPRCRARCVQGSSCCPGCRARVGGTRCAAWRSPTCSASRGRSPTSWSSTAASRSRPTRSSCSTPRRRGATPPRSRRSSAPTSSSPWAAPIPVGLVRLVSGLSDLADVVPGADVRVVVTRVRESLVGRRGKAAVAEALHRHAGVDHVWCVPDDRRRLRRGAALRVDARGGRVVVARAARAARGDAPSCVRDLGSSSPAPPRRDTCDARGPTGPVARRRGARPDGHATGTDPAPDAPTWTGARSSTSTGSGSTSTTTSSRATACGSCS